MKIVRAHARIYSRTTFRAQRSLVGGVHSFRSGGDVVADSVGASERRAAFPTNVTGLLVRFFFCLIIFAFDLYIDHGGVHFAQFFLSAVHAVAARCKLPFALRPGLSQEREDAP